MIRAAWQALVAGHLRHARGRTLLSVLAVAAGVALGFAVHLVNASAAAEFRRAALQLAGEAELIVRGPREGFDESLYPRIARLPGIAVASPVLELQAARGEGPALRIAGLDALRAWPLQSALVPPGRGPGAELFDPDALHLSAAAAKAFGVAVGDWLEFRSGTRGLRLRVASILPAEAYSQPLGLMDIAAAQLHFDRIGVLNRIDLRLAPDADAAAVQAALAALLPPGVHALTPEAENARSAGLTRAYRTNLDMLALIALLTGAFVVYSTQVLAVLRRHAQIALLRALGLTRRAVFGLLLAEGALIGAAGAVAGLLGGWLLARLLLAWSGADLGAGYFRLLQAELRVDGLPVLLFFLLGIGSALAGAAIPAAHSAGLAPALGLRAGDPPEKPRQGRRRIGGGLAALLCGAALGTLPAVAGMPLAGYAAVALLLAGSVMLLPAALLQLLRRATLRLPLQLALARARLLALPRRATAGLASIVVSFSLVVAMTLMIHSFRSSLDVWLERVLPADLYLRPAGGGDTGFLTPADEERIARLPGIARAEFLLSRQLLLAADRPAVTLIARDPGAGGFAQALPLVSEVRELPAGSAPPAWISEQLAALHGLRTGDRLQLPLGPGLSTWTVAGIWRDYARQAGAVVIGRAAYAAVSGDPRSNDAALWLAPGAAPDAVAAALRRALPEGAAVEIASAADIRRLSLDIFDRTFAVTWALQLAALATGLLGIGLACSADALSRRREFGMLRHLGMTRRAIIAMLAGEGALVAGAGVLCGFASGTAIGLLLVHVINRQSFHWSMDLAAPWPAFAVLAAAVTACAALAAAAGASAALRRDPALAVREDW